MNLIGSERDRSGGGRGAALDTVNDVVIDGKHGWPKDRTRALEAKSQLRNRELGEGGDGRKNGVRTGSQVVAALVGVSFSGVLNRPQVIADRNDRKQDDEKHRQRNKGGSPISIRMLPKPKPKARGHDDYKCPYGIEEYFHFHFRAYTNEGLGSREDGSGKTADRSEG